VERKELICWASSPELFLTANRSTFNQWPSYFFFFLSIVCISIGW